MNAPGSFLWLTIILPPTGTGEITPELVTWLSSIKNKDLNGCGKFTLVGDMPTDTVKVDLSNMDSLEGSLDYFANCKAITSFNVNGCKKLTGNSLLILIRIRTARRARPVGVRPQGNN